MNLTTQNTKGQSGLTSTLATRINAEHQAYMQAAGKAIEHAMRCGDLLIEAKRSCQHGKWQGWLAEHFEGAARTARGYMQLAKNRELLESKRRTSAVLGIDGAVRFLASPKSVAEPDSRSAELIKHETIIENCIATDVLMFEALCQGAEILGISPEERFDKLAKKTPDLLIFGSFHEHGNQVRRWRNMPWFDEARSRVLSGATNTDDGVLLDLEVGASNG